jgi:hypothetical protein
MVKKSTPEKQSGPTRPKQIDLAKLPYLDNNGLKYLPTMQYFPLDQICPMQPINAVEGDALNVLIHMPNGGFNCIALPIAALDGENEQK